MCNGGWVSRGAAQLWPCRVLRGQHNLPASCLGLGMSPRPMPMQTTASFWETGAIFSTVSLITGSAHEAPDHCCVLSTCDEVCVGHTLSHLILTTVRTGWWFIPLSKSGNWGSERLNDLPTDVKPRSLYLHWNNPSFPPRDQKQGF